MLKRGFRRKRPLVDGAWVHGSKLKPFLDFYPAQVEALKGAMESYSRRHRNTL